MYVRRVVISSMPRAGSMWTYNVTRAMIAAAGWNVCPDKVPTGTKKYLKLVAQGPLPPGRVYCLKTHHQAVSIGAAGRILSPVRDIRAVALSYMRFMACSFDDIFPELPEMMEMADAYVEANSPYIKIIRYERIRNESLDVLREIDAFLGIGLDESTRVEINEQFDRRHVQSLVASLPSAEHADEDVTCTFKTVGNRYGPPRAFDRGTGFQTGHVSSRSEDEWREALTEEQQQRLMDISADWLVRHGFDI